MHFGSTTDGGEKLYRVTENNCWEWLGSVFITGYGCYKRTFAHRVFYEQFVGKISKGNQIHHKCSNKLCVNPAHLIELSQHDHQKEHRRMRSHCKNGHLYSPENTRLRSGNGRSAGTRVCKTCHRQANMKSAHR